MKNVIQIGQTVEIMAVNDFQSLKYSIGNTFKVRAIADVGSDNALYVSEDYLTWFHPIDLKVIDDTTDPLWDDFKKSLLPTVHYGEHNINGDFVILEKDMTDEMRKDRAFIIAAVSCDLIEFIREKHDEWLDDSGYAAYYDLVIELVDRMMFTDGSMYLKYYYAPEEEKENGFWHFADDCFDWYHMRLAPTLIDDKLLHEICYGKKE